MNEAREYIDSYEENKNGLMALKKAIDLGGEFDMRLRNDEIITVASPVAKALHDALLLIQPRFREKIIEDMMASREEFVKHARLLTVASV